MNRTLVQLIVLMTVATTIALAERPHYSTGAVFSYDGHYKVAFEGWRNEGTMGLQRLVVNHDNISIADTLLDFYILPKISNTGNVAIVYIDSVVLFNQYLEKQWCWQKAGVTFNAEWGAAPLWMFFADEGNNLFVLGKEKTEYSIFSISLTGQLLAKTSLGKSDYLQPLGASGNSLLLVGQQDVAAEKETNLRQVVRLNPDGKMQKAATFSMPDTYARIFYNRFDNRLYCMTDLGKISAIDLDNPDLPVELSNRELEDPLLTLSLRAMQLVLRRYEHQNYVYSSEEGLNRLLNHIDTIKQKHGSCNGIIGQIASLAHYVRGVYYFNRRVPNTWSVFDND